MFSSRKIVLLIVLLITISIAAYVIIVVIPTRLAEKSYAGAKEIGRDISNLFSFTPEITVNNTVVLQQQTPILELATLSQKFHHKYEWTNTWLRSTKKITIEGGFEAKAGYDLHKRFAIDIQGDKAIITMPQPTLLSIQPMENMTFRDENGVWNWVNMDDRSKAVNAFNADARRFAMEGDFILQSRETLEKKLREILQGHGKTVEIQYEDTPRITPM